MKRKITTRKKFSECTFEDFRQEDKLELLVKILSSEEILQQLYHNEGILALVGSLKSVLLDVETRRRGDLRSALWTGPT